MRVWRKPGVGHGLPYGLSYGPPYGPPYCLSVVNFVKTWLSIAVSNLSYLQPSSILLAAFHSNVWVWTKCGVGHGLPYGPPYDLPVTNFLKVALALLLTCVNSMSHESVIPATLFCPFGGILLRFSRQTRGRLE